MSVEIKHLAVSREIVLLERLTRAPRLWP